MRLRGFGAYTFASGVASVDSFAFTVDDTYHINNSITFQSKYRAGNAPIELHTSLEFDFLVWVQDIQDGSKSRSVRNIFVIPQSEVAKHVRHAKNDKGEAICVLNYTEVFSKYLHGILRDVWEPCVTLLLKKKKRRKK